MSTFIIYPFHDFCADYEIYTATFEEMYVVWAPEYEQNTEEKQLHLARLQDGIDRKKAHIEKTIQVCIQLGTYNPPSSQS